MIRRLQHLGFSIVELLIAMLIGLALVLLVTNLYLSSKSSYRLNQERMRLYQDGNNAMHLMVRNLRQAGFGHLTLSGMDTTAAHRTDFIDADGTAGQGLRGCANGFVKPLSGGDFACSRVPNMDSFEVGFRVSDVFDSASGAGADCNGQRAVVMDLPSDHPAYETHKTVRIARNRFFVASRTGHVSPSLYCQGNGNASAQPILNHVEDMRLIYGVAAAGDTNVEQFLDADAVSDLSDNQKENWKRVMSVELCLQIRSDQNVMLQGQRYIGCDGEDRLATDRKLHVTLTRVVTLRNHAASSLH